ncbi:GNAT family N-acetyltransferase [Paratissierella segnis]|jgi:ribosomal protein S18 acetylase RimI-like enzyme|uniref:GNAT family N-acetyltransferase n=1 Tax=Paratissierella segnis TaxID=2763679 RepID=A0A926IEU2_9FIRM|nr:GNAT family N-acetyltransferase [Paratissierella segnis]MBC8587757.1 GNAT family N-acetyltransferase [Paratissierella segnis]
MNKIEIKEDIILGIEEIINLYEDVEWHAYTKDKVKLKNGIENSLKVLTAWEDDKLVGLIRVVGDSHTIVYIQDILVLKKYQGKGIGSKLLSLILEKYKSIRQIVLMTDNTKETISFYKKNGMVDTAKYNGVAFVRYNLN